MEYNIFIVIYTSIVFGVHSKVSGWSQNVLSCATALPMDHQYGQTKRASGRYLFSPFSHLNIHGFLATNVCFRFLGIKW